METPSDHDTRTMNGGINPGPPPRRKPPKLRKGPPPGPQANGVNGKSTNHAPDSTTSTTSKASSAESGSISFDKKQNGELPPSPEPTPQPEPQRTRHHRRHHRVPAKSQEPSSSHHPESESERGDDDSREQRTIKEKRVSHVLNPVESQGEVGRPLNDAGGLVPNAPVEAVEQVTESTEPKPKNDQLKLRLDLNLDIEVELKAKIRGDLTLQLLQ